jgi:hypothetical protein
LTPSAVITDDDTPYCPQKLQADTNIKLVTPY